MSKFDKLLIDAIYKKEESIIATRDLFFKRFTEYVEKTFDGNLNYRMEVITKSTGYALGDGTKFEYYEVGSKSTYGDLENFVNDWVDDMLDKFPFFDNTTSQRKIKAESSAGLRDDAISERSKRWRFDNLTVTTIKLSAKYIDNLRNKIYADLQNADPQQADQLADQKHVDTPGEDNVIIDQFPCGLCEESSDERIMMHCSKGKYHATICVKCYENEKVACTICGTVPNRLKCKVIRVH